MYPFSLCISQLMVYFSFTTIHYLLSTHLLFSFSILLCGLNRSSLLFSFHLSHTPSFMHFNFHLIFSILRILSFHFSTFLSLRVTFILYLSLLFFQFFLQMYLSQELILYECTFTLKDLHDSLPLIIP